MALSAAIVMRRTTSAPPPELQEWVGMSDLPAHPPMLLLRIICAW